MSEQSKELATTPKAWLSIRDKCITALPSHMSREGERFWQIAYGLVRSADLSKCSEVSIGLAIYSCAKLGLVPDPTLGHVYIIPYKSTATVIIGFKGYVELAHRHPKFKGFICPPTIVYANDNFDHVLGSSPKIVHRSWRLSGESEPGRPIACYLIANIAGTKQPEIMWADEIETIKANVHAVRQGRQTPWTESHETEMEMWKKTVVRRAQKRWPLNPELALAASLEDAYDRGESQATVIGSIEPELIEPGTGSFSDAITEDDIDRALGE